MTENESLTKKRSFASPVDEDVVYYIDTPTAEDIRGADWQYSKLYTKCLMEDIPTSSEMVDILTRRGIIGPEFEQRANELSRNLTIAISNLDACDDVNQKRRLALDVHNAREELFQWNQRLNGPMNNTAEQISDDARLEYLTSAIVKDDKLERLWPSYDAYLKEKNQALALKARFEVMLYLQGLNSDFLEQTPEARAIREVDADTLEKAKATLRAQAAVDEEEAAPSVEEDTLDVEEKDEVTEDESDQVVDISEDEKDIITSVSSEVVEEKENTKVKKPTSKKKKG